MSNIYRTRVNGVEFMVRPGTDDQSVFSMHHNGMVLEFTCQTSFLSEKLRLIAKEFGRLDGW